MPIGYQRGNTYHLHHAGDRYMELPIFKLLTDYAMKRKFGTHISWTHITRAYDVDLREIVYFKHSGQPYMMSRANRGGANPLEALVAAIQVALPPTPLLRALCLEAEVVLLAMTVDDWKALEAKIGKVLDELAALLPLIETTYDCEDCIGMIEHGCYCASQGAQVPGGPGRQKAEPEWDRKKEIIPKADVARVIEPLTSGIPAAPGEDDDL